jgi:ribosomal-protein-alanine N-acetyltransferase
MPGARVATGDSVSLRTAEAEDIGFLQRAYADPDLRTPLGWDVRSRAELETEFEDKFGHDEVFVVCLDESDARAGQPSPDAVRRIGCVVTSMPERARAGLGLWLLPDVQGNGYGTEACSLAIDYVFDVHPHPAVRAKVLPDNDASRGLLESLGFTQEGRARRDAFWNGEYRDAVLYGLLREEWRDGD